MDQSNPYSEIFKLRNGGYIPVTDLDAHCRSSLIGPGNNRIDNYGAHFLGFADYLGHDGTVTIPCFRAITREGPGQNRKRRYVGNRNCVLSVPRKFVQTPTLTTISV